MADKKKQHYVPKFYLRNFSDGDGKSIHLINLKSQKTIINATLKHQCYEDYFYGKDLKVEAGLEGIEGLAATVVRSILSEIAVPAPLSEEHVVMVSFVSIQHGRTKHAAEDNDAVTDYMEKIRFRAHPDFKDVPLDDYKFGFENPAQLPLSTSAIYGISMTDLRIKLIHNLSSEPFITSDNPVVMYNRYLEHITIASSNGMAMQGLIVFLPLSPTVTMVMYDDQIYRVGGNRHDVVETYSRNDVFRLNNLQCLNALDNVFFCDEADMDSIGAQAQRSLASRQTFEPRIVEFKQAVPQPGYQTESIVQVRSHQLRTGLELSFLSIRESKRKVPLDQRPIVMRNSEVIKFIDKFQKDVYAGNCKAGDIYGYLFPGMFNVKSD